MTAHPSDTHPHVMARVEAARHAAKARVRALDLLNEESLTEAVQAAKDGGDDSLANAISQVLRRRSMLNDRVGAP